MTFFRYPKILTKKPNMSWGKKVHFSFPPKVEYLFHWFYVLKDQYSQSFCNLFVIFVRRLPVQRLSKKKELCKTNWPAQKPRHSTLFINKNGLLVFLQYRPDRGCIRSTNPCDSACTWWLYHIPNDQDPKHGQIREQPLGINCTNRRLRRMRLHEQNLITILTS